MSADLARLRTAARGTSSDELFYLGRLVASAHNLLYRDRRSSIREILTFVAIDVPTTLSAEARSAVEALRDATTGDDPRAGLNAASPKGA